MLCLPCNFFLSFFISSFFFIFHFRLCFFFVCNSHDVLGVIAKVRRSPAKRTKFHLKPPPFPWNEQNFALQASTLRPTYIQNTIWSLKCDFFENPTLPNEFCSFYWASANFCDGPLPDPCTPKVTPSLFIFVKIKTESTGIGPLSK